MSWRPSDWSPLGLDADPTPGDPVVVRDGGQYYQQVAQALAGSAATLRALNGGATTGSQSVTALLEGCGEVLDDVTRAYGRYRVAGDALVAYAYSLDRVQAATAQALATARVAAEQADADRRLAASEDETVKALEDAGDETWKDLRDAWDKTWKALQETSEEMELLWEQMRLLWQQIERLLGEAWQRVTGHPLSSPSADEVRSIVTSAAQPDSGRNVFVVGSTRELFDLFFQLTAGGKPDTPGTIQVSLCSCQMGHELA